MVLPKPINWKYVFANANFTKNKTIYLTVICVSAIFVALLIYARYKDREDRQKLVVAPLADNHQDDSYFYQMLVFTGQRTGSGTTSKVSPPTESNRFSIRDRFISYSTVTRMQRRFERSRIRIERFYNAVTWMRFSSVCPSIGSSM
jgi:hypothetical protein